MKLRCIVTFRTEDGELTEAAEVDLPDRCLVTKIGLEAGTTEMQRFFVYAPNIPLGFGEPNKETAPWWRVE